MFLTVTTDPFFIYIKKETKKKNQIHAPFVKYIKDLLIEESISYD